ncbi:Molybdenum transport system permease protein ModB [Fundidesulfovibrio magnetotacticus]|uniref:Molybdenum transport system permease n=1 Tax=Fundidesulfovibrio magnetotacticus TaxID=2730080 RepID=A0A6V8M5M6_9BACT|nr:molybdate ABC transporter permease subunit [Fundidesulfovibrio magnetotacticus]GFK95875.1 Molybdenum transport system permease protein ModB [Fundidesulfovibrio magnetotacticus]
MDSVTAPLLLTLKVALLATLGALCAGVPGAWALSRRDFPGRSVLDALATMPMVLPPTVLGYYLLVLFGRNGVLGRWLLETFGVTLMFSWQGAVVASAVVAFPLVFTTARAAFDAVDANLVDAARTLGSSGLALFARVSLPLAWRGILAGAMLAFARAMGEFGATLMIAGNIPGKTQTLSLAVYSAVMAGQDGQAAFLTLVVTLASMAVLVGSGRLVRPKS